MPNHSPNASQQTVAQVVAGFEQLPRRQQSLAHLIIDHPEMVAFSSAREVAARVHVNAATVVRFAQALGYSGFNALQSAVRRAYLHGAGLLAPRDPSTTEGPAGAIGAIRDVHLGNITRAYENLAAADIEAIADRIINARRTFVWAWSADCSSACCGTSACAGFRIAPPASTASSTPRIGTPTTSSS
jgi:DNA-binding MurR/RpiR family transcriptional regulator